MVIIGSEGLDDTNDGDVIFVSQYKSSPVPITIDCTNSPDEETDHTKVVHINEEQHCEMDEDTDDVQDISTISSIKLADFCSRSNQIYHCNGDTDDQLVIKPGDSLGSLSISNNFSLSLSVEDHGKTPSKPVMVVDVSTRIETPMENDSESCNHELNVCDKCLPNKEETPHSGMDFRTDFITNNERKVIMKKEENVLPKTSEMCKWNVTESIISDKNCEVQKPGSLQIHEAETDNAVSLASCNQSTSLLSPKCDPCCSDSTQSSGLIYHCMKGKDGIDEHSVAICQKVKGKFCHTTSDSSPQENTTETSSGIDTNSSGKKHQIVSQSWIPTSMMVEDNSSREIKQGTCVACKVVIKENEGSSCVDHHFTCRGCLEEKVKAVLSRRCLEVSKLFLSLTKQSKSILTNFHS